MGIDKKTEDKLPELCKRAEDILGETLNAIREVPPEDIKKWVHELRVHRIELEMQNEELRRSQLELEAARDRYRTLYDFAPVGYLTISEKGIVLDANLTSTSLLGAERLLLIDKPFSRFISKDFQDEFYLHMKQVFQTETRCSCELILVKNDGSQFHAQLESLTVHDSEDDFNQFRTTIMDITERKQAEEEIHSLAKFPDENPNPVFRVSKDGNVLYTNEATSPLLNLWGCRVNQPLPDEFRKPVLDAISSGSSKETEVECEERIYSLTFTPVIDEKYVNVYGYDITDRKKAEGRVKEQLKFLETLMNTLPTPVFYKDEDGKYTGCNKAFEEFIGRSREEIVGKTVYDMGPKEIADNYYEKDQELFRNHPGRQSYEWKVKAKNGVLRDVIFDKATFTDADGKVGGLIGVISDITERKRAEEEKQRLESQLRQAQKIEAIGTLAGGVAHDFNNILSPILIHTELVKLSLAQKHPVQENLEEVLKAGHRAKDLVQHILAFSRQEKQKSIYFDMRTAVGEILKLIRATIPSSIQIIQQIPDAPATIMGDPTGIHEVVMNLCTNAAQAMDEMGSVLHVELREVELDQENLRELPDLSPGKYLRLSVSDTGHGIPLDIIGKIFDPYFTTKEVGKGTGMGLSVVHGIVKEHGGAITVYSEPGRETTFRVFFPKAEGAPLQQTHEIKVFPTGTERVLFVDDEEAIARSGTQMLERLGYQVDSRTSSVEAFEIFRKNPNEYDLVVTDMTMPNMTGDVLAKEMMKIRPDIPIILCTGFSYRIDEHQAKAMGIKGWIMKPFIMRETAETIRTVLDASSR